MRHPFLLLALLLLAACDHGHGERQHGPYIYVANQGEATVTIFDADRDEIVETLDLRRFGFGANAQPHFFAVEPDGSAWYVSLIGENAVAKFDRENRLLGRVTLASAGMLSLSEDGQTLYVSRSLTAVNPPASIGVVNRRTMTLVEERPVVHPHPHGLVAVPGGAITASLVANQVIALRDGETRFTEVAGPPQGLSHLARTSDATLLAASADLTGQVHFFRLTGGVPAYEASVTLGGRPWHPHFSHDGHTLYVPLLGADEIAVVDVASRQATARITGDGIAEPYVAMLSPDGKKLYVTNNNRKGTYATQTPGAGTVAIIDLTTRRVTRVIEVGRYPTGIAMAGAHH